MAPLTKRWVGGLGGPGGLRQLKKCAENLTAMMFITLGDPTVEGVQKVHLSPPGPPRQPSYRAAAPHQWHASSRALGARTRETQQ
jgi:hypothetical protein